MLFNTNKSFTNAFNLDKTIIVNIMKNILVMHHIVKIYN